MLETKLKTKWLKNQKTFLAPLGVLYLVFVIARVVDAGISLGDFLPTNEVVTAGALYLLNAAYDYLRKFTGR